MTTISVTDQFFPPFVAMAFGDGWAPIDANANFPAPAILALGETIPGYTDGDTEWQAADDSAWAIRVADELNAQAAG